MQKTIAFDPQYRDFAEQLKGQLQPMTLDELLVAREQACVVLDAANAILFDGHASPRVEGYTPARLDVEIPWIGDYNTLLSRIASKNVPFNQVEFYSFAQKLSWLIDEPEPTLEQVRSKRDELVAERDRYEAELAADRSNGSLARRNLCNGTLTVLSCLFPELDQSAG